MHCIYTAGIGNFVLNMHFLYQADSKWIILLYTGANTERKSKHQWWEKCPNLHCSQKDCDTKMTPDYDYENQTICTL